jgi:hypothetical protein
MFWPYSHHQANIIVLYFQELISTLITTIMLISLHSESIGIVLQLFIYLFIYTVKS